MRQSFLILAAAVIGFLTSSFARADFMYRFEQPSYTVAPGGTVDVRVFLQETGTSILSTDGLISAGVRVRFDVAPAPTIPAEVLSLGDIFWNPAFDAGPPLNQTILAAGSYAGLAEAVDLLTPPVTSSGSAGIIELGLFRFTAGTIPGEVTHLLATDLSSAAETVTGGLIELDGSILDGRATITVTEPNGQAVPLPGGFLLLSLGLAALVGYGHGGRGRRG